MKKPVWKTSTAIAAILALSVGGLQPLGAQEQVDCSLPENANLEACANAAQTSEEPAEQQAAPEQPAEQPAEQQAAPEQPAEQPAEQQAAPEQPAEQPAEQQAAPEQPAEQPAEQQAAPEQPAEQPAEQQAAPEQPAEQPAEQQAAPEQPAEQKAEQQAEQVPPAKPAEGEAMQAVEEPVAVVPDEITEAERERLRAEERERRQEARERRNELLGAAAVGAVVGAVLPQLGGTVVDDQGDRLILERDGRYFVRKDESSLLRERDVEINVQRLRGGNTLETITRRNGVQILTVRDPGGNILSRTRVLPDGTEYVLIDNRDFDFTERFDYDRDLPPLVVDLPRDVYIVPAGQADEEEIYETLVAPPVEEVERRYSLREVRDSQRLRAKVRRIDLDTITFDTGSAFVSEGQVEQLENIANGAIEAIEKDPETVLLIEGHTDAIGSDISNLALSDRRAETVARILVDRYQVPAENLVTEGYGEQYLKVETEAAERANRRVTMRNITPLISKAGN